MYLVSHVFLYTQTVINRLCQIHQSHAYRVPGTTGGKLYDHSGETQTEHPRIVLYTGGRGKDM